MYALYALSVAGKPLGEERKTKPRTVRLYASMDSWLERQGRRHVDGMSGVINDALAFYKAHGKGKKAKNA